MLNDLKAVCLPTSSVHHTTLDKCIWTGLSGLHVTHCLSQYAEYAGNSRVSFLFRDILKLGDATYQTYLQELTYLRKQKFVRSKFFKHVSVTHTNFKHVCAVYAELLITCTTGEASGAIR